MALFPRESLIVFPEIPDTSREPTIVVIEVRSSELLELPYLMSLRERITKMNREYFAIPMEHPHIDNYTERG